MSFRRIFLDKPERVTGFLGPAEVNYLKRLSESGKKPAMVEIAGRDSVAAAVKAVENDNYTDLLPVYAYTGTEYGAWAAVETAVDRLKKILPDVEIHPLQIVGSPVFWRALNGRFVSELIQQFGFFSPCPGCHLYLHAIRIPLAKELGSMPIIAGERESHSGMVKINQAASALDFYLDFARRFDTELQFPLRHIKSGEAIEEILQIPWHRGKEQLQCVLSGNYRSVKEINMIRDAEVLHFFENFAGPAAETIVQSYLSGKSPDHAGAAESVLFRL